MVLRLSLYSSQSPGGTKIIRILITVSLVVQHPSLYSSQSPSGGSDYPYTHRSLPCVTREISIQITVSLVVLRIPFTQHSLPGGTQTIPIFITISLRVLRLSITYHSLHGGSQTILLHIKVSLVELRLSHYSSQSP